LQQYPGALGIKTGFTGNAGYCFCGAAEQNGTTLVSAVLACGWPPNKTYKWSDTKKLMDYGFEGFKSSQIPLEKAAVTLPVLEGQKTQLALTRQEENASLTLPLKADDTITITKKLPENITAPVRSGDIIGYEYYSLNGECYLKIPLVASQDIKKADTSYLLHILLRLFLMWK
jgi:D-alanyl-D-alanine carboxypeptidase (penicillin-binding protein 5/6)